MPIHPFLFLIIKRKFILKKLKTNKLFYSSNYYYKFVLLSRTLFCLKYFYKFFFKTKISTLHSDSRHFKSNYGFTPGRLSLDLDDFIIHKYNNTKSTKLVTKKYY